MSKALLALQNAAATLADEIRQQYLETQRHWNAEPDADGIYPRPDEVTVFSLDQLKDAAKLCKINAKPTLKAVNLLLGSLLERQTPEVQAYLRTELPIVMAKLERITKQPRYTPPPFLKKDEWYTATEVTAAMAHALGLKGHTLNTRMVDLLEQAGILKTKKGRYMLTDYQEPEWMQRIQKGHGESGDYLDD